VPDVPVLSQRTVSGILSALLSRGGEHAELFFEESRSLSVLLDDGRVERVVSGDLRDRVPCSVSLADERAVSSIPSDAGGDR